MSDIEFHTYETREQLAEALAIGVAGVLGGGMATRGSANLAVSGGSTPKLFFEQLSKAEIEWASVKVRLVDERIVPPDHERSNAGLANRYLLQARATDAELIPYVVDGQTPEECAEKSEPLMAIEDGRLDAVILGMGTDGHTASFFPQGSRLLSAIDLDDDRNVIAMEAPGAGEPRLTMTLPFILDARFIALHIEGEEKRRVYEQALAGTDLLEMPVRAVLQQNVAPVHVFWAP
ncbi:MAG: 6-phosphogluconolactonase [Pseudomonadota bacterium]